MADLRIPIVLNKGRKGIPLQKLARISYELQQFLGLLGEDLQIEMGAGWLGTDFYNGSLGFTAEISPSADRMPECVRPRFASSPKSQSQWKPGKR